MKLPPRPRAAAHGSLASQPAGRIVFITGTDTGAGKTILTALLLLHWRSRGVRAAAIKPFATGSLADARLLARCQGGAQAVERVTPFLFRAPVAPLVAARRERRQVSLAEAVAVVRAAQTDDAMLFVEGCGGLLTPLGAGYTARELIRELNCPTLVAARNRLGVLNQALLAVTALQAVGLTPAGIVLLACARADASTATNAGALRELVAPVPVFALPYLGPRAGSLANLVAAAAKQRGLLARLSATFWEGATNA